MTGSPVQFKLFQMMAGARVGGAELFFERLAIAFHQAGVPQQVCIKPHSARVARLSDAGLTVHRAGFSPLFGPFERLRFRQLARQAEADILLSWMNRATQLAPKGRFVHVARLGGYYNLKYYTDCDYLVANTQGIADYLIREGVPARKVHHQVNFVPDGTAVPPLPRPPETKDKIIIAALGRLHPNKGFDTLLAALGHCRDIHLLLAGIGPEQEALKQQADQLGLNNHISFLGWQDSPQAVIRAADIFICPSRHEPFGNVIAEAFACGRPVIATASQGAVEYINTSQTQTGMIVPVDDSPALAGAITELAQNPALRAELAEAGYREWAARFHPEQVVESWISYLNRVA